MRVRRHRISAELFAVLADGGGGSAAVSQLAAVDLSRRMLFVRGIVEMSRKSGDARHDMASQAYELLAAMQQDTPNAVDAVLRHPAVGAWAWRTVRALHSRRQERRADPVGLALIAGAAAIRARFSCDIAVPVADGVIMFPSLGQALVPGGSGAGPRLRSGPAGAEVVAGRRGVLIPGDPHQDTVDWRGLRQISVRADGAPLRLLIDDLDPHRLPVPTLRARLGAGEVMAWESGLAGAWQLLSRHHETVAEEVSTAIRVLTPLTAPAHGGQASATSRETFGCVGVSSATDPLELAAALAHEVQHAKLYQITEIEPLVLADDGSRYYAPWRADPRPLSALLQGAYAYLGVTGFWRRQCHEETGDGAFRAHREFARWRAAVATVARTLRASHRLTQAGEVFVTRMARVADAWCDEPVPAAAEAQARHDAERHTRNWHHGQ